MSKIPDRNFGALGFKYNRWQADLEEDQTIDDALKPEFWSGQAQKIMGHDLNRGRGDIIEVRKLSEGFFAELLVTEVGNGYIKVDLLRKREEPPVPLAADSPLVPKWNVGKRAFDVIRTTDKSVISSGFQTKASAAKWIDDHLKKMAA